MTIAGGNSNPPDKTFQMLLLGGGGGTFTSSFATQQTFATGAPPFSVVAADFNGDGLPDLVVANRTARYRCCSIPRPRAPTTPSFAAEQTFCRQCPGLGDGGRPQRRRPARPDRGEPERQHGLGATQHHRSRRHYGELRQPSRFLPSGSAPSLGDGGRRQRRRQARSDRREWSGNTVSVLLNTTAAGASTPSFATQQTFATGSRAGVGDRGRLQRRRQARPDRREQRRQHGLGAAQHDRAGRGDAELRHPADLHVGQRAGLGDCGRRQRRRPGPT